MSAIKFQDHTKEKIDEINYYYKTWFKIVKRQKAYIIDTHAGTGYNKIQGEQIKGSALLAIDLFKDNEYNNLTVYLININHEECKQLRENILEYITENKIDAKIDKHIIIMNDDWSNVINDILVQTEDGIRLFLLDPYAIRSFPWNKVLPLIKKGVSEHQYKESGIELLINWAWHAIRRKIAKYYSLENNHTETIKKGIESDVGHLDNFFGSVNWRQIADKYPNNIFSQKNYTQIINLRDELIFAYTKSYFEYFKYVKIHPVHARRKTKDKYIKEKGTVKYFLIFASNYRDALNIIDVKFKQYREQKVFATLPKDQTSLEHWAPSLPSSESQTIKSKILIADRIKAVETDLGSNLFKINKEIIKYLYRRKNHDYGTFLFDLHKKFEIDDHHYSLQYLLDKHILNVREKNAKSSDFQDKYYYLCHPKLVDRSEYLFYNDTIYKFENDQFIKF